MDAIDGIDLASTVEEARATILKERREKILSAVGGVIRDLATWQKDVQAAEQTIVKRKEAIGKAQAKLKALQAGDWSVLPEEKKSDQ